MADKKDLTTRATIVQQIGYLSQHQLPAATHKQLLH